MSLETPHTKSQIVILLGIGKCNWLEKWVLGLLTGRNIVGLFLSQLDRGIVSFSLTDEILLGVLDFLLDMLFLLVLAAVIQ